MTLDMQHSEVKTECSLGLFGKAGRRIEYVLRVKKDQGGEWRLESLKNSRTGAQWDPEFIFHAENLGLLTPDELATLNEGAVDARSHREIRARIRHALRPPTADIEKMYNRLAKAHVRVIISNHGGRVRGTPARGDFVSISFEKGGPPPRKEFRAFNIIDYVPIATVD